MFRSPVLILLWCVFTADLIIRLMPFGFHSAGTMKYRKEFFRATADASGRSSLSKEIRRLNLEALRAFLFFAAANLLYMVPYWLFKSRGRPAIFAGFGAPEILLIVLLYYILDMLFVLYWCPFRNLIVGNRCCTTCRIYNWDAIMNFTPLFLIPTTVFSLPLLALSFAHFAVWEISVHTHPERFTVQTNAALSCAACRVDICPRNIKNKTGTGPHKAAVIADKAYNLKEKLSERTEKGAVSQSRSQ